MVTQFFRPTAIPKGVDMIKVSKLKLRDRNPRKITDEKMLLLEASISRDPEFMLYRPIVVDDNSIVLGGNMRLRAIRNLGMIEIPNDWVVKVKDLPPEKQRRFILVDNMSYGEWDADIMKMDWTPEELSDVGFDPGILDFKPEPEAEPEPPNTPPQPEPELKSEALVEIRCTKDFLQTIQETLSEWAENGATIDIS